MGSEVNQKNSEMIELEISLWMGFGCMGCHFFFSFCEHPKIGRNYCLGEGLLYFGSCVTLK